MSPPPEIVRNSAVACLLTLVPCASCTSIATQGNMVRATTVVGAPSATPVRQVFTSKLAPPPQLLAGDTMDEGGRRPSGTVRIVVRDDDTLEYLITIFNPTGESFTGAHIHRAAKGESHHGPAVATLFADVALSQPYVQLRGTIALPRGEAAARLCDELRDGPAAFYINVHSSAEPDGAIRGVIE